jgi:hypothetical protein
MECIRYPVHATEFVLIVLPSTCEIITFTICVILLINIRKGNSGAPSLWLPVKFYKKQRCCHMCMYDEHLLLYRKKRKNTHQMSSFAVLRASSGLSPSSILYP